MRLFTQVVSPGNLHRAWKYVRSHAALVGVDHAAIQAFGKDLSAKLNTLKKDLVQNTFIPEPDRQVFIPKPGKPGEIRELRIPRVRDRIVQQAVRQVIEPIMEKKFSQSSYAYRPGKGARKALRRLQHEIRKSHARFAIKSDIDNFFNTIDHEVLAGELRRHFHDEPILELIRLFTANGVIARDGKYLGISEGVPTGSLLAPVLSNIYLHPLDMFITKMNPGYIRYADDFIVVHSNQDELLEQRKKIQEFLRKKLKLRLNKEEKDIYPLRTGAPFLGFLVRRDRLLMLNKKFKSMRMKLQQLRGTSRHRKIRKVLEKARQIIGGWIAYYSLTDHTHDLETIDSIILRFVSELIYQRIKSGEVKSVREISSLMPDLPLFIQDLDTAVQIVTEKVRVLIRREELNAKNQNRIKQSCAKKQRATRGGSREKAIDPAPQKKRSRRSGSVSGKLAKQRRVYEKAYAKTSELVVWTRRTSLGCTKKRITWRVEGKRKREINIDRINHIFIGTDSVTLSGKLIHLCSAHHVPITFSKRDGYPAAVVHVPSGTDVDLLTRQLRLFQSVSGLNIAKQMTRGKINNQINLLKYFSKYLEKSDPQRDQIVDESIQRMESVLKSLTRWVPGADNPRGRETLLAFESRAAAWYWQGVRTIIADDIVFEKREHQHAKNVFNMALNYGYGILYGKLHTLCIISGLNPAVGLLHKPFRGKPVLTYDLIEEFRAYIVDRTVISMVTKHEKLKSVEGRLTPYTRKRLASKILQRMAMPCAYRKQRISVENVMRRQIERLKLNLTKDKKYKPFIARW